MDSPPISCSLCGTPLPLALLASRQPGRCPACNAMIQAILYPAAFRDDSKSPVGEAILVEGEASCFYHPTKRAEVPCDDCGRFLCAVCDIPMNSRHICPACMEGGAQQSEPPLLKNSQILYDSLALTVALLTSIFLWPVWIVTGPAVIGLAILSWFRPPSLIPRTRARSFIALLVGLGQIAGTIAIWRNISFT